MYASLLNGSTTEEIASVLTELQIPTGGRKKDGTLNTDWTSSGVLNIMRNERYCGDVLGLDGEMLFRFRNGMEVTVE